MDNGFIYKALGIISVPVILLILLLPFSFITGWSLATAVIYWLFITPFVSEYVPTLFSKNKNQLRHSIIGMLIFYSIMVVMIFKSFQTDMFAIMIVSCVINLGLVTLISYVKKVNRVPSY